MEDSIPFR